MRILFIGILTAMVLQPSFAKEKMNIKPGLWETTSVMKKDGKVFDPYAQIKKILDYLPKEQAQMMKKKMLEHADPMILEPGPKTHCLSQEDINKGLYYQAEQIQGCTFVEKGKSKTQASLTFDCKNQGISSSGTVDVVVLGEKQYTTTIKTKTEGMNLEVILSGKHIKATCPKK